MTLKQRTPRRPGSPTTLKQAAVSGLTALLILAGAAACGGGDEAAASSNQDHATTQPEPLEGPAVFDSSFRNGKVQIDGGYLHYVEGGTGPVLVLIHGWPETWWEWRKVMPALAKTHTVIAFDLPGLGQSSIPQGGYDTKTTATRLHQAVNNLGYNNVEVMGHDLGVLIGYDWARDYPDEVSRLAVLDSSLLGFGLEDVFSLSFHFRLNMAPSPIPEQIIDNNDVATYLNYVFQFAAVPEAIDRQYYINAYSDPARRTAGYNYYRAFPQDSEDNKANATKRLTMPVLAMGADHLFGLGVAKSFQNVADDVRGVVAPGAGHWIQEETPQFVIDCANLFFGPAGVAAPSKELENCVA